MSTRTLLLILAMVLVAPVVSAHDLFIRCDSYFVEPGSEHLAPMINGTFDKSENSITQDRVTRFVLAGASGPADLSMEGWDSSTETTYLPVKIGKAGTYVLGVFTAPRSITLEGKDFNTYLAHDGIPDVLAARKEANEMDKPAVELYSKHVKAVLQAGDKKTEGWKQVLGAPAELVPLANPYDLKAGDEFQVRVLVDGKPVPNQLVIAGGESQKGPIAEQKARSDDSGAATFHIGVRGTWYIKFINMSRTDKEGVDYESKWATLTFRVR